MGTRNIILFSCDKCGLELIDAQSGVYFPLSSVLVVGGTQTPSGSDKGVRLVPENTRGSNNDRESGVYCLRCFLEMLPKPKQTARTEKTREMQSIFVDQLAAINAALDDKLGV